MSFVFNRSGRLCFPNLIFFIASSTSHVYISFLSPITTSERVYALLYCVSLISETTLTQDTSDCLLFWPPDNMSRDKTNKMTCAPSEDSDQPEHPRSLIRVFAIRMNIPWVLSYPLSTLRRLIRLSNGRIRPD